MASVAGGAGEWVVATTCWAVAWSLRGSVLWVPYERLASCQAGDRQRRFPVRPQAPISPRLRARHGTNRYPIPSSVIRCTGRDGSASNLLRSWEIYTRR